MESGGRSSDWYRHMRSRFHQSVRTLVSLLTRYPVQTLILWVILTGIAGYGLRFLKFDFSPESVYSGQDQEIAFCEAHKQLFRFEDSQCLVVLESTDTRSLARTDCLRWLQDVGAHALEIDGVQGVTSLMTLERPQIRLDGDREPGADRLEWVPLVSARDLASQEQLEDRLRRLPLLNDLLISDDRQLLLLLISLDPSQRSMDGIRPRVAAIEQLLDYVPPPEGTRVRMSGVPPIRVDIIRSLQSDQQLMVPLCSVVFILLALWIFRSISVTAISLFAVGSSVLMTVGIMGWTNQTFNLLSNVVPPLSLIIAAANTVHIVSRLQVVLSTNHSPQRISVRTAVQDVISEMVVTCFLTLATTAIGFGSLWLAKSELLQTLATQAVIAMICNYFCLLFVLTSGLTLTGHTLIRRPPELQARQDSTTASESAERPVFAILGRYAGWLIRNHRAIIVFHFLICGVCLLWTRDMRINAYMFETYDDSHEAMQTIRLLDQKLSGLVSLEIQLSSNERSELFQRETVKAIQQIRRQLQNDPRVSFIRDYVQVLESVDGRVASEDEPQAADAAARLERMLERLDLSRVTRSFISESTPRARIMLRVHDLGSAELQVLIDRIEALTQQTLPEKITATVTGDAFLHTLCMDVFVRDLFVSLVAASGIIFLLIAVLFRSIRLGLISAVPNLLPLLTTVAWMKFRGFDLTAGNVIVFSISLGIAVDDTIHFLTRYLAERKSADNPAIAVSRTVCSCGRAIFMTSLLIVGGLSLLGSSDFVPTRRFAELTSVTMAAALPGDILLLPALLLAFDRKKG